MAWTAQESWEASREAAADTVLSKVTPLHLPTQAGSYGSPKAPGTFLCCDGPYAGLERPLTPAELKQSAFGHTRRLSCEELLASLSWRYDEIPRLKGSEQQ